MPAETYGVEYSCDIGHEEVRWVVIGSVEAKPDGPTFIADDPHDETCPKCGLAASPADPCATCSGAGWTHISPQVGGDVDCTACRGTGVALLEEVRDAG
jgi:DnaJ-class molecular chaperone